ncbi:MAG TPA: mechanosensitive ion channel family protein, partial [Verrucomicrobiae bacterium]|nr:mechanosensitive ion channel family protein [Verrucomicrobiae bacterium]
QPSALVRKVEQIETTSLTFKLDELPFLRSHTFLGEPLWKYCASLVYILLAFLVARLFDVAANIWLRKIAARTATKLDDLFLDLLRGPVKVVAFVLLLNIGLNFFNWSVQAKLYFSKALIVVVAAALTYLAVQALNLFLEAWKRRHAQEADRRFNDELFSVIRISLNTFIVVVAVLVTAQNMDVNITAAIASLSIGGLAVGLAAQDTLANLFGALAVFVDKPFRVGDQIKLDGAEGTVEVVGLRSTRVRSPEGFLVAVPNKTVGNAIVTNISRRPYLKTVLNLVLPHDLPAAKVKRAIESIEQTYRGNPKTHQVWVSFNQFSGPNLNLRIEHWWNGNNDQEYRAGLQEMNLAIRDKLAAEGIALL